MLELPASMRIHNVFHVSLTKKYVTNWNFIQVEHEGNFLVELVHILDQKFKVPRNISIALVKVQWTFYGPGDATWENEESMREAYPHIFSIFEEN
jgi:hypothetical protein